MTSLQLYSQMPCWRKRKQKTQHIVPKAEGDHHEAAYSRRLRGIKLVCVATCLVVAANVGGNAEAFTQEQLDAITAALEETSHQQTWIKRNEMYLGPFAILVSASVSWILARLAINSNREISQKRATFDYMSHLRWDNDFIEATRTYLECRRGKTRMAHLAEEYEKIDPNNGDLSSAQQAIIKKHDHIKRLLNEYEAIAVGINSGALSEEVVVRNYKQAIISTVEECQDFIEKTREHAGKKGYSKPEKIYKEIQEKVENWKQSK